MLCRRCKAVQTDGAALCVCCADDLRHEGPSTTPEPSWARRPRRPITSAPVEDPDRSPWELSRVVRERERVEKERAAMTAPVIVDEVAEVAEVETPATPAAALSIIAEARAALAPLDRLGDDGDSTAPRSTEPVSSPAESVGDSPVPDGGASAHPTAITRRVWRTLDDRARVLRATTATVAELLDDAADLDAIVLVGPPPGGGGAPALRAWADAGAEGWTLIDARTRDARAPVLRYRHDATERELEIRHAAEWGLPDSASVAECGSALRAVAELAGDRFGPGAKLLGSPAFTAHEWFARCIETGAEYPTLPADLQRLIRSTSGQGRAEIVDGPDELAQLVEYDGRLMYGALCRELPYGPVEHDAGDEWLGYTPARYRVRFTPPAGWDHVGVLAVKADDVGGGWRWPTEGTHETWCDGAELHVALGVGWSVSILERLWWPQRGEGPVRRWADRLLRMHDALPDPLARAVVRRLLLAGIGSWHGSPRAVERSAPADRTDLVTGELAGPVTVDGDRIRWTTLEPFGRPAMAHPEWSAAVWGRCRARLLQAPNDTGALRLRPGSVVALRTDALWLDHDPEWADTGRVGAFRRRTVVDGPLERPRTLAALMEARRSTVGV